PAFDGKSLTGWDYLPANWRVQDDMIIGSSNGTLKHNTFLCSQKKYRDFEMTFKVRLTSGHKGDANTANSGVQIRHEVIDREKWIVKGPQCDMGSKYWGSLYGEKFGKGMMKASDFAKIQPTFKPDEFNDYFIRV